MWTKRPKAAVAGLATMVLLALVGFFPAAAAPLASGCGGSWSAPSKSCSFSRPTINDMLLRVEGTSTGGQVRVIAYAFRVLGSRYELLRCSGLLACERGRLYVSLLTSIRPPISHEHAATGAPPWVQPDEVMLPHRVLHDRQTQLLGGPRHPAAGGRWSATE
jgi:hypothetical protein